MKKYVSSKLVIGFLILAMGSHSCQKFNLNTDDLDIRLSLDIIKTSYSIQFIDAKTGLLIGGNDETQIRVKVFGRDSQYVLDPSGNRMPEYYTNSGTLVISLDPYEAKPTQNDPVEFTLVADLEGYLATSVSFNSVEEGIFSDEVSMVQIVNPPSGVDITVDTDAGISDSGEVTEDIKVETLNSGVVMTIDAGTQLKDEMGNSLDGRIEVMVASFSPTDPEAVNSFPGGLDVTVVNEEGGSTSGKFITAGFVAVEIKDESGKQAALIEGASLHLDITIDPAVINPETGKPIQAGDAIPLWSYNEKTGEWKFEATLAAISSPKGMMVTTQLQHLSWYNVDWLPSGAATCEQSGRFIYRTTYENRNRCVNFNVEEWRMNPDGTETYLGNMNTYTMQPYYEGKPSMPATCWFGFTRPPTGWLIRLKFNQVTSECGMRTYQTPQDIIINLCDNQQDYYIDLIANVYAWLDISVVIFCEDLNQRVVPTQAIQARYRKMGTDCWVTQWVENGTARIYGVLQNSTYEIQAYYQGEWQPASPYQKFVGTESAVTFEVPMRCGN